MINQHTHKDKTGAICAYINGLVTDYALTPDGKLGRICLTSPGITDNPFYPNVKHPFDSHLWLRADLLDVMGDYADPADPNPEIHNQTDDHSGCLYIGDLLVIAARINSYRSHGRRKLGVGEWTPLGRSLQYGFTGVDNRTKVKAVPMHLIKHMRVLKLTKDGTPLWADAHMLEREIARWKKQFPDSADEMRVTVTIH
ncbi:hypothetical protein [Bifidobacterium sp. SO1]|uniref:hypothetical protein n=1 Tax=Bifidobacterium sp. SO1 TaxID=2809029 RepID=UPI001BDD6114|nr:hypothetical protein [Bifidobacterium sp. SO1]MBT1162566.1 hypothetical protein [Bifidobacterium sp. SO1]